MLGAALIVGVTPVEAKEIVYQAVPYVGMAKVYDFLHATNEVLTERGVQLPLSDQATTNTETRADKGREVQGQIIGADRVENLYASASEDQMHIQRYLSANCFGDHIARDGIDTPTRELLTLAICMVGTLLLPAALLAQQARGFAAQPELDLAITYTAQRGGVTSGSSFWAQGGSVEAWS